MAGRNVEGREVVVVVLDLRALEHFEAEAEEDVLEQTPRLADDVQTAERLRWIARQGHVDPVGGQALLELAPLELAAAFVEQSLELSARSVRLLADLRAAFGRQRADRAQELRELGLATQVADAQILQLGEARGGPNRPLGLLDQPTRVEPLRYLCHGQDPICRCTS